MHSRSIKSLLELELGSKLADTCKLATTALPLMSDPIGCNTEAGMLAMLQSLLAGQSEHTVLTRQAIEKHDQQAIVIAQLSEEQKRQADASAAQAIVNERTNAALELIRNQMSEIQKNQAKTTPRNPNGKDRAITPPRSSGPSGPIRGAPVYAEGMYGESSTGGMTGESSTGGMTGESSSRGQYASGSTRTGQKRTLRVIDESYNEIDVADIEDEDSAEDMDTPSIQVADDRKRPRLAATSDISELLKELFSTSHEMCVGIHCMIGLRFGKGSLFHLLGKSDEFLMEQLLANINADGRMTVASFSRTRTDELDEKVRETMKPRWVQGSVQISESDAKWAATWDYLCKRTTVGNARRFFQHLSLGTNTSVIKDPVKPHAPPPPQDAPAPEKTVISALFTRLIKLRISRKGKSDTVPSINLIMKKEFAVFHAFISDFCHNDGTGKDSAPFVDKSQEVVLQKYNLLTLLFLSNGTAYASKNMHTGFWELNGEVNYGMFALLTVLIGAPDLDQTQTIYTAFETIYKRLRGLFCSSTGSSNATFSNVPKVSAFVGKIRKQANTLCYCLMTLLPTTDNVSTIALTKPAYNTAARPYALYMAKITADVEQYTRDFKRLPNGDEPGIQNIVPTKAGYRVKELRRMRKDNLVVNMQYEFGLMSRYMRTSVEEIRRMASDTIVLDLRPVFTNMLEERRRQKPSGRAKSATRLTAQAAAAPPAYAPTRSDSGMASDAGYSTTPIGESCGFPNGGMHGGSGLSEDLSDHFDPTETHERSRLPAGSPSNLFGELSGASSGLWTPEWQSADGQRPLE